MTLAISEHHFESSLNIRNEITQVQRPEEFDDEIPPGFTDNPEEILLSLLKHRQFFDHEGNLAKEYPRIESLSENCSAKLYRDLNVNYVFNGKNSLNFTTSIFNYLKYILGTLEEHISSIQLVGGGVNLYLSKDFIIDTLNSIGLKNLSKMPIGELSVKFNKKLNDLDFRIILKDSVLTYIDPNTNEIGLKAFQNKIRYTLCEYIKENSSFESSILDNAFVKKCEFIQDQTGMFIYAIKNKSDQYRVEFAFFYNLKRKFLFENDAMGIELTPIVKNPLAKAPLVTYRNGGWPAFFAKILGEIGIVQPEETNVLAFLLCLVGEVKGKVRKSVVGSKELLDHYIELLKTTKLPRKTRNKYPKILSEQELRVITIFEQFQLCVKNHFPRNHEAVFFLALTLCNSLTSTSLSQDIPLLWEYLKNYVVKTKSTSSNSLINLLCEHITNKEISFQQVDQFFTVHCYLHALYGIKSSEGLVVRQKTHLNTNYLQIQWKESYYLLPFAPIQAINAIAAINTSTFQLYASFLSLNPIPITCSISSCLLLQPLEIEALKHSICALLKQTHTYFLGYSLWMAINNKIYRDPEQTPLYHLPRAYFQQGSQLIDRMNALPDISQEHSELFQSMSHSNFTVIKHSDCYVLCIEMMLKSTHETISSAGWHLFNILMNSDTGIKTKHSIFHRLFFKFQNVAINLRFFQNSPLSAKEQTQYLVQLLNLATSQDDSSTLHDILFLVSQWSHHETVLDARKSELWFKYVLKTFSIDTKQSLFLWKQGYDRNFFYKIPRKSKDEYYNLLFDLLKYVEQIDCKKSKEQILQVLVTCKLNEEQKVRLRGILANEMLQGEEAYLAIVSDSRKASLFEPTVFLEYKIKKLEFKVKTPGIPYREITQDFCSLLSDIIPVSFHDRFSKLFESMINKFDAITLIPFVIENSFFLENHLHLVIEASKKLYDYDLKKMSRASYHVVVALLNKIHDIKNESYEQCGTILNICIYTLENLFGSKLKVDPLLKVSMETWKTSFDNVFSYDLIRLYKTLHAHGIVEKFDPTTFSHVLECLKIQFNDVYFLENIHQLLTNGNNPIVQRIFLVESETKFMTTMITHLINAELYDLSDFWITKMKECDDELFLHILESHLNRGKYTEALVFINGLKNFKPDTIPKTVELLCQEFKTEKIKILILKYKFFTKYKIEHLNDLIAEAAINASKIIEQPALALELMNKYKVTDFKTWQHALLNISKSNDSKNHEIAWLFYQYQLKLPHFKQQHEANSTPEWLEILSKMSGCGFFKSLNESRLKAKLEYYFNDKGRNMDLFQSGIKQGDHQLILELILLANSINEGTLINEVLPNGELPLHYAVRLNQRNIVPNLLKAGANPFLRDYQNLNAMDHAKLGNNPLILAEIIGHKIGKDVKLVREEIQSKRTTFHLQSLKKRLLETYSIDVNQLQFPYKHAYAGQMDPHKIPPKCFHNSDAKGLKVTHYAILGGQVGLVKEILKSKLDPNAFLAFREDGDSLLHLAAVSNSVEMVKELMSHNLPLDHQNKYGETALHYAAAFDHLDIIEILVKAGADPFIKDIHEISPLVHIGNSANFKDPLSISKSDILLFGITAFYWISTLAFDVSEGSKFLLMMMIGTFMFPMEFVKDTLFKYIITNMIWFSGTFGLQFFSKYLPTFSLCVSGVSVGLVSISIFQSLKNCYRNYYARPVKTAFNVFTNVIKGLNIVHKIYFTSNITFKLFTYLSHEKKIDLASQEKPSVLLKEVFNYLSFIKENYVGESLFFNIPDCVDPNANIPLSEECLNSLLIEVDALNNAFLKVHPALGAI